MRVGSFKNVAYKLFIYKSYIQYIYKPELESNNLKELIYHKSNQPTYFQDTFF